MGISSPFNPNVAVVESDQIDSLNLFNNASPSDDVATLTDRRIYGLGMGPDTQIAGVPFDGGIRYSNLEALAIHLGTGGDHLTIETTHAGTTHVTGGGVSDPNKTDTIDVVSIVGHTSISLGDGVGTVNVGDDTARIDSIAALLTIDGAGLDDTLNIHDQGDTDDNTGYLTATTLTGLDLPGLTELQVVETRADGGSYQLITDGFGTNAGLVDSTDVVRAAEYATLTLTPGLNADQLAAKLETLYGVTGGIRVVADTDGPTTRYEIMFGGELAGTDLPQLEVSNQVQHLQLGADSTQVTGSFTLEYDGQQVAVDVGADDAETRANIESQLNTIPGQPIQVAVTLAGTGQFDITFNTPTGTAIDALVFADAGLIGAVRAGVTNNRLTITGQRTVELKQPPCATDRSHPT